MPELWTPSSAVLVEANPLVSAESLFDGDGATGFTTQAGGRTSVRLELGSVREVLGLGVHGDGRAKVALFAEDAQGVRTPISATRDTPLKLEPDHWAQVVPAHSAKTSALIVEWTAAPTGAATVTELALWVAGRSRESLAEAAVADRLVTQLPENAGVATASPRTASVARVTPNGPVSATFGLKVNRDPRLGRAFLVYELDKKAHWTGVARSINGHVVRGGYRADAKGLGGVQVEEINPAWLTTGDNTIAFEPTLTEDGHGYTINNVRIVTIPRGIDAEPPRDARSPLSDGDLSTGLGGPGGHAASLSVAVDGDPAFLSFFLDKPTRGTLTVSAVGERARHKGQVSVDLAGRSAGWQSVPVAGILPNTSEVRVRVLGDRESTAQVSEVRLQEFPVVASAANLTMSYPLHGECNDHKTYVRGFVSGPGHMQKPQLFVDGQLAIGKIDADGSFEANVQEPASVRGKPWSIRLEVASQDGARRTRTVPVDTCVEPPKGRIIGVSPPVEDVGAPYGAVVSPEKASTLSFAGAKVEIPAGAVDANVRVTMRALGRAQTQPVAAEMDNVTTGGGALRLGPHGLKFSKPIKVTLPIDASQMPRGMNSGDVVAFFFDEGSGKWTQLPKVAGHADRIVAETTHFTDFIASTIRTPNHPDMQEFNPNTMKGVKVGEPGAGITMIQPPDANSNGSARLSYPIETPTGRNGIGPRLSLTYDSDRVNSNGWLGVGWDLRMSSIEIDTRFGVPKYDGNDVYSLDGSLLLPTGTSGTTTTYVRRIESSFDLIQRQGNTPDNAFWTVTDKSGTVYTYGSGNSNCGPPAGLTSCHSRLANPRPQPPSGSLMAPQGAIFRWYLEKVQDTYGNVMSISYQHDSYTTGTSPNVEPYDEVYPSAIDYTQNGALAANYHVTFTLDAVGTRPDPFINARAGFLVSTRHRLSDIIVKSGTTLVRQYHFVYYDQNTNQTLQQNLADTLQKSLLSAVALWGVQGDPTSELYRHTFEYQKAPAASAMFSQQQTWGNMWMQVPPPGNGGEIRPDNALSHSVDNLVGGSVTLGVGFPTVSVTGSFGVDTGGSTPDLAFLGISGEGLPGQVDTKGFLSQTALVGQQPGDHIIPSSVGGLTSLGATDREGFTAGGNVSVLQGFGGAGLSYGRHLSNDSSLFSDINGDGFPDLLVENGGNITAYLNDGKRNFSAGQQWTGYSLADSPFSTASRMTDPTVAQSTFKTDPLVRWVAPFSGTVTINSSLTTGVVDPIRAELYVANDPVKSVTTQSGTTLVSNYVRSVNAGDKIYMRVVAQGNHPSNDFVEFDTSVAYSPPSGRSASEVDQTGSPVFNFNSHDDIWLTGQPRIPWHLTADGDVGVTRCFGASPLDDLTVSYVLRDKTGALIKSYDLVVPANGTACFPTSVIPQSQSDASMGMFYNVSQDQTLGLEYTADSPVGPLALGQTLPANGHTMSYTRYCRLGVCGAPQPSGSGYTVAGDPYGTEFPIPTTDIVRDWPPEYRQMRIWQTFNNGNVTTPQPVRSLPAPSSSVTFGGTVKTTATLTEDVVVLIQGVWKRHAKLKIPKNTPANTTFSLTSGAIGVTSGEPIFFTVYSPTVVGGNVTWAPTINGVPLTTTQLNSINKSIRDATFDNNPPAGDNSRDPMNGGFRRWFFGDWNDSIAFCDNLYNPSTKSGCANPILRTSAAPQDNDAVMGDVPAATGQPGTQIWNGRGGSQIFALDAGCFMVPGQVNPPNATATDGSSSSALRIADTWNVNLQASLAGVTAGVNGGDATTQVDFFDFNGDRYPDSITRSGVQFNDGASTFSTRHGVDMSINGASEIRRILNASLSGGVSLSSASSRQVINESSGNGTTKKLSATASISASADYGVSSTRIDFVDVNGDGLVDHVREEDSDHMLRVRLNLGYGFSAEIPWTASDWSQSTAYPVMNWPGLTNVVPANQIFTALNKVAGALASSPGSTNVIRLQDTGSLGATIGGAYGPVGGGGGPTYSVTRTWVDLMDVNGDGLPDQVLKIPGDPLLRVKLNTGTGFAAEQQWTLPPWTASTNTNFSFLTPDGLGFSTVDGWGKNLSFQFCFIVCFGASGFESDSNGGPSAQFEDIDGDGKLDQVMKVPGDSTVYAKLNNIGQTNLLTAVNRPLGGRIEIGYQRSGNHVDLAATPMVNMPSNQWVMANVVTHSLYSGEKVDLSACTTSGGGTLPSPDQPMVQTFDFTNTNGYGSGYFDPVERENLGYANANTRIPCEDTGGTAINREYFNQNYYLHGLESSTEWLQHGTEATIVRSTSDGYKDPSGKVAEQTPPRTGTFFPSPNTKFTFFQEMGTGLKSHLVTQTFDTNGNLTDVVDSGDLDIHDGSDTFNYHVDYWSGANGTNITVPQAITVRTGATSSGALLAKRTVDNFFPTGKPNTVTDWIVNGKDPATGATRTEAAAGKATWTFVYDGYGNVQTATPPSNTPTPGYTTGTRPLTYTYDTTTQTYPVTTTEVDSDPNAQYSSSAAYDLRFGLPTRYIDVAGARQEIDYDNYGRVTKVFAPTDFDANGNRINTNAPTIGVSYSGVPHTAGTAQTLPAWAMASHLTAIPGEGSLPGTQLPPPSTLHTVNFVDGVERILQVKKDISRDDGLGNRTDGMSVSGPTIFDARGRVFQQGQPTFAAGLGSTAFVNVPMAYPTQYAYDVLSRLRQEQHPDNGVTATTTISFQMGVSPTDGRSYIVKLTSDPKFAENPTFHYKTEYRTVRDEVKLLAEPTEVNAAVTTLYTAYDYDLLSRVVKVTDAQTPTGNVTTAVYDTVGNLVNLTSPDAGSREWRYCVGGYVCAEISPNAQKVNKQMTFTYDRDRLKTISYPSDPTVTYVYGNAGEKGSANGYKADRIKQRTDEAGQVTYAYDALGNVASEAATLVNQMGQGTACPSPIPAGKLCYAPFTTSYTWDKFGRLIEVAIPGTTTPSVPSENVRYGYDAGGAVTSAWGTAAGTNYDYVKHVGYNEFGEKVRITYGNLAFSTYTYAPDTRRLSTAQTTIQDTSQARLAQSLSYSYDLVGNLKQRTQVLPYDTIATDMPLVGGNNTGQFYYDPLDQLTHEDLYSQVQQSQAYAASVDIAYDGIGNITTKSQTDNQYSYDPAGNQIGNPNQPPSTNYTFIPSYTGAPHAPTSISENHLGVMQTRNLSYDADGNITASLYSGTGKGIAWTDTDRVRSICTGTPGSNCPAISQALYTADGTRTHNKVSTPGGSSNETLYVNQFLTVRNGTLPTKHIYLGDVRVASKVQGSGAPISFWYHSDNVQSTQYMTTTGQVLTQHLEYFPGGEIWREETGTALSQVSQVAHQTTFTGKELDPSGYYYFGARYYEPQTQMWLSPDPILGSYMKGGPVGGVFQPRNLGLYTYARNNPVVVRDRDGLFGEKVIAGCQAGGVRGCVAGAGAELLVPLFAAIGAGLAWASDFMMKHGGGMSVEAGVPPYVDMNDYDALPQTHMNENKSASATPPPATPVKPGDRGAYGDLKGQKAKHGETEPMDMDHQPSFAAQKAAAEKKLGRPLRPDEVKELKAKTPAVASPRDVHRQTSPTYGGRNNPEKVAGDAADLKAAETRDRAAFDKAMKDR